MPNALRSRAELDLHVERSGLCADCGEPTDFDPKITDLYGDLCAGCARSHQQMAACDVAHDND